MAHVLNDRAREGSLRARRAAATSRPQPYSALPASAAFLPPPVPATFRASSTRERPRSFVCMSHLPPYALTLFACVAVLGVHLSHAGPLLRLCSDSGSSQLEMRAWFFQIIPHVSLTTRANLSPKPRDFATTALSPRRRAYRAIADPRTLARCSRWPWRALTPSCRPGHV